MLERRSIDDCQNFLLKKIEEKVGIKFKRYPFSEQSFEQFEIGSSERFIHLDSKNNIIWFKGQPVGVEFVVAGKKAPPDCFFRLNDAA